MQREREKDEGGREAGRQGGREAGRQGERETDRWAGEGGRQGGERRGQRERARRERKVDREEKTTWGTDWRGKVDTEMWTIDRTSWRESKIWLKNTQRGLFESIMQLQQCSKRL